MAACWCCCSLLGRCSRASLLAYAHLFKPSPYRRPAAAHPCVALLHHPPQISRDIREHVGDADAYGTIAGVAWAGKRCMPLVGCMAAALHMRLQAPAFCCRVLTSVSLCPLTHLTPDIYTDLGDFEKAAQYYGASGCPAAVVPVP